MSNISIFNSFWNCQNVRFPERSYLYHLQLRGAGSAFVESLTSYITRLAQSHNVFPGILMGREIAPLINKANSGANLHKIYDRTATLNGTGVMALNLVQALQSLTLHDNLQYSTMLPWTEVLPTRGLLRSVRAWCPTCYDEWQSNSQILYEPLIWAIDAVRVCSFHHQFLATQCPHCQQANQPLAWKSRPGYCSRCQEWLGSFYGKELPYITTPELEWLLWVAHSVGGLLAVTSTLKFPCSGQRVAQALKFYVDQVTEGNVAELARRLKVPKNTLSLWYNGSNLPTLESLLRICYFLNTPLQDFLTGELQTLSQEQTALLPSPKRKPRNSSRAFDRYYLQHLQHKLQEFLDSDGVPPLSMKQTAERLGHDRRTIYSHFPDLCHEISVKYDNYRKTQYLEAIEQACAEAHRIVLELHSESIYPSEVHVARRMNRPGHLRYKQVRAALHKARLEAKS